MSESVTIKITICTIEDSAGIILPKDVLDRFGLKEGDTLTVQVAEDLPDVVFQTASLERQMHAARMFMEKYKTTLQKLAKS